MPGSYTDIGSIGLMSPSHPVLAPAAAADDDHDNDDEESRAWSPADYMRLLNIGTAKFLAVVLVVVLASYHSILHVTYGVTPCKGLLKNGMYKVADKMNF